MSRKNKLSGIIKSAATQLSSSKERVDFKLVWLHARGQNPEVQTEQMEATLYGSTNIFNLNSNNSNLITCYYFTSSDFYRHKDIIDGAIVSNDEQGKLCLNTLSPRYKKLKESELCKAFKDGVCDPLQKEKEQAAYIVDTDIDRKDKANILIYLQNKYNRTHLMDLNMTYSSASVSIPKN